MNYLDNYNILNFNVTWFCPVNCSYCHIRSRASLSDKMIVSESKLVETCTKAKEYGIEEFRISGGEPTTLGDQLFHYASLIEEHTGHKPNLLTSGYKIDDQWLKKAANKFCGIYLSVENPLEPLQKVVPVAKTMSLIKNATPELPFRYGLTLIEAKHFKNLETIFDVLYDNSNGLAMPQLDYPSLLSFVPPNRKQLTDIYLATKAIFSRHGVIPNYFPNIVGSMLLFGNNRKRVLVNLNPDGKFEHFENFMESVENEVRWRTYCLDQQRDSDYCGRCEWTDVCKHHSGFWRGIRFDWCHLRMAIYKGMYEGLEGKFGDKIENSYSAQPQLSNNVHYV